MGGAGPQARVCDIYNDAGSSTLTLNGSILDLNSYVGQMSLRGANPGVINGNVNVPGATVAKDDGGTWTINSGTNVWGNTAVLAGTPETWPGERPPRNYDSHRGWRKRNSSAGFEWVQSDHFRTSRRRK